MGPVMESYLPLTNQTGYTLGKGGGENILTAAAARQTRPERSR